MDRTEANYRRLVSEYVYAVNDIGGWTKRSQSTKQLEAIMSVRPEIEFWAAWQRNKRYLLNSCLFRLQMDPKYRISGSGTQIIGYLHMWHEHNTVSSNLVWVWIYASPNWTKKKTNRNYNHNNESPNTPTYVDCKFISIQINSLISISIQNKKRNETRKKTNAHIKHNRFMHIYTKRQRWKLS